MTEKENNKHHQEPALEKFIPFEEKYPNVSVSLSKQKSGFGSASSTLEPIPFVEKIDCSEHKCVEGGFKTVGKIEELIGKKKRSGKFSIYCGGKLGTGELAQKCPAKIILVIKIEYKDKTDTEEENIKMNESKE